MPSSPILNILKKQNRMILPFWVDNGRDAGIWTRITDSRSLHNAIILHPDMLFFVWNVGWNVSRETLWWTFSFWTFWTRFWTNCGHSGQIGDNSGHGSGQTVDLIRIGLISLPCEGSVLPLNYGSMMFHVKHLTPFCLFISILWTRRESNSCFRNANAAFYRWTTGPGMFHVKHLEARFTWNTMLPSTFP